MDRGGSGTSQQWMSAGLSSSPSLHPISPASVSSLRSTSLRSLSSYRQRGPTWEEIEAAAQAQGYAIPSPSSSANHEVKSPRGQRRSSDEGKDGEVDEQKTDAKVNEPKKGTEEPGEHVPSSSSFSPTTSPPLSPTHTKHSREEGEGEGEKKKKKKTKKKKNESDEVDKPSKKKDKKEKKAKRSQAKENSAPSRPTLITSPSSSYESVPLNCDRSEEQSEQENTLMVRVSVPERRMVRMVRFARDTTVQSAIEQLFLRNPLSADISEYGLAVATDPSFVNPFSPAMTRLNSSMSGGSPDVTNQTTPPETPSRWLDDHRLLSSCFIRPDQMVELKKKPQPIFITLEDGSKKSVIIDPIATAQDLANLLVEDLADEISRERQLFDFDCYCVVKTSSGVGSKNPATPSSVAGPVSPVMSDSFWLEREKPLTTYGIHSLQPDRYLLQWKKRPHIIKVQLHAKSIQSGSTKATLKYYYDTTAKEVVKYLVGKYLGAEENPEEYSLQETTSQSLRRRRVPTDIYSPGNSGEWFTNADGSNSNSGVPAEGLGSNVKDKIQLFNTGSSCRRGNSSTEGMSTSSGTLATRGGSGNGSLRMEKQPSVTNLQGSRSLVSVPTTNVEGSEASTISEDGFWLDGDDTLSQYELTPKDTLHLRIDPHKIVQEPVNCVNVYFIEAPELFPTLASLVREEEELFLGDINASSSQPTQESPFSRKFKFDFSTTARDLIDSIKDYLINAREKPEASTFEGYQLYLLRADAHGREVAKLLNPSTLLLPLGLSLKDSIFFRRTDAVVPSDALDIFFSGGEGEVKCHIAVPSRGIQIDLGIGPDELVADVKRTLIQRLGLNNKGEGWSLNLCDPYNGRRTPLNDTSIALSYPVYSQSILEFTPPRTAPVGVSGSVLGIVPRKKKGTKLLRVRVKMESTEEAAYEETRVLIKNTQSTVDNLMQEVAGQLAQPSIYEQWSNFVRGKDKEGKLQALYLEPKDEQGGVYLLNPFALVSDYSLDDEDVLWLTGVKDPIKNERESITMESTVTIRVNMPSRSALAQPILRSMPKSNTDERKTFTFPFSPSTLVGEALSFAFTQLRHQDDATQPHLTKETHAKAEASGSGSGSSNSNRPSLDGGLVEQPRLEEEIRWWEQQWQVLLEHAEGRDDDPALKRRFGLFLGGSGGSFINLASPSGSTLSSTITRTHLTGGPAPTWLSPLRTLASYGISPRSVIDFQVRPIRVRVGYKSGQSLGIDVEPRCPVGELLLHSILHKPSNVKAYSKSQNLSLWLPTSTCGDRTKGLWLNAEFTIACYLGLSDPSGLKLHLRVHKEPCTFEKVDGSKLILNVDYSQSLHDVLSALNQKKGIASVFKFTERNLSMMCIFARATKRRMDMNKSLRENGFSGGDASIVLVNKQVRIKSSSAMVSVGVIQSPAVSRKGEPKRSAVEIGRRNIDQAKTKASEELQIFVELAGKEELREDNSATSEVDESWIAAAERAGLGINIWREPPDSPDNLILDSKTGKVSAATLNKLVMRMTATTSSEDYDPKFMQAFLITYQSFTTPVVLLNKLLERYHVPTSTCEAGMNESEWREKVVFPIQFRVVNILNQWLDSCFDDFDAFLITKLNKFIQITLPTDGHSPLAKKLAKTLIKKTSADPAKLERIFAQAPPTPKVPRNLYSNNLNFFDIDDEEIARQITLIEYEMFTRIKHKEFLQQAWNNPKLQHLAPNVLDFVDRFNVVSGWVSLMIVKVEMIRNRARMLTKLINIAKHLHALNNFSCLMAFIAGWNTSSVIRLKWTMKELPKKTIELRDSLEAVMSCEFSWRSYRTAIHEANPPCLPYLGVYLQDLIFIEEGNPDYLAGLINFSKRELVAGVIREIQQYQRQPYNLQEVPRIAELFRNLPRKSDDELYNLSLKREPRGADRSAIA